MMIDDVRCEQTKQTVKELVDNAIDACRGRSCEQDPPTVRVVLRRPSQAAREGSEPAGLDEGERKFMTVNEKMQAGGVVLITMHGRSLLTVDPCRQGGARGNRIRLNPPPRRASHENARAYEEETKRRNEKKKKREGKGTGNKKSRY